MMNLKQCRPERPYIELILLDGGTTRIEADEDNVIRLPPETFAGIRIFHDGATVKGFDHTTPSRGGDT